MVKRIPLTQGAFALVDAEDFEWLGKWSWCVRRARHGAVYAGRGQWKRRPDGTPYKHTVLMHREILNAPDGTQVDHIDGDKLNNTRANLRLATFSTNQANTPKQKLYGSRPPSSGYKGVCIVKHRRMKTVRWRASITVNGRTLYLGEHRSEVTAALAYDRAALEYFGEYARLNFPLGA